MKTANCALKLASVSFFFRRAPPPKRSIFGANCALKLVFRYSDNITILYDGDAAGIKASFRGIDMILSHGMNVKVVLFPDGEDPDSYAKSHSTEEVKAYIEDSAKDFIVFKSDVLLKDAGNDPIKKAGLIGDIVTSISLIPDSIKQQIYIKECSKIFSCKVSC